VPKSAQRKADGAGGVDRQVAVGHSAVSQAREHALTQVAGQPAATSAVMFTQIAILFEVVADRRAPERLR
jgi:hypothetical protein